MCYACYQSLFYIPGFCMLMIISLVHFQKMQRCQIRVLSPLAQYHVGVGSKHAIVLVTDRVLEEKIALRSARSLKSNHAMLTTAMVSHCLLYFEIVRSADSHRHLFTKCADFSLIEIKLF